MRSRSLVSCGLFRLSILLAICSPIIVEASQHAEPEPAPIGPGVSVTIDLGRASKHLVELVLNPELKGTWDKLRSKTSMIHEGAVRQKGKGTQFLLTGYKHAIDIVEDPLQVLIKEDSSPGPFGAPNRKVQSVFWEGNDLKLFNSKAVEPLAIQMLNALLADSVYPSVREFSRKIESIHSIQVESRPDGTTHFTISGIGLSGGDIPTARGTLTIVERTEKGFGGPVPVYEVRSEVRDLSVTGRSKN